MSGLPTVWAGWSGGAVTSSDGDAGGFVWIFVEPACDQRHIVVTTSVRCMFVRSACVRPSGFVRPVTSIFMHNSKSFGTVVLLDE